MRVPILVAALVAAVIGIMFTFVPRVLLSDMPEKPCRDGLVVIASGTNWYTCGLPAKEGYQAGDDVARGA